MMFFVALGYQINIPKYMRLSNYTGISIRNAMEKINNLNSGWYLPKVQRQYVWGSRDSSEEYICLLVDSLLRGYPIGGLVLWETTSKIPYRKFIEDFSEGTITRIVEGGNWGGLKSLVYDGQQRLQTLYSVLYHRFNNKVLFFDLLFDLNAHEIDESGFFFSNEKTEIKPFSIRMTELMRTTNTTKSKIQLEEKYLKNTVLSNDQKVIVRENIENLWRIFVEDGVESIAYFAVKSDDSREVNEVFRRLNTGGIPLTQLELVLAKIKEVSTYFEEELWEISELIKNVTNGYKFSAQEIVQLMYLIIYETTRVDESRIEENGIRKFINLLPTVKEVLIDFFKYYMFELFHINSNRIIPRKQALLPMIAYGIILKTNNYEWKIVKRDNTKMTEYFLKSQFCDWNTQTMVTMFAREVINAAKIGKNFPLDAISKIAVEKNRTSDIFLDQFKCQKWFALKILTPERLYVFLDETPQIDHIFPLALHKKLSDDSIYRKEVDVIWNMQPTPSKLNNAKRKTHPKDFFSSKEGAQFFDSYDHVFSLTSSVWNGHKSFIFWRMFKMLKYLKQRYKISIKKAA